MGDDCTIGEESVVMPGVRIYPFKEVESGSLVDRHLIWESRLSSRLIGLDGISGRINVELTPETALRLGIALGAALERGARVVTSRAASTSCRLIRRALIAGVNSTGVHAADLQVMPAAVNRHFLKTEGFDAGIHVQPSPSDPEWCISHLRAAGHAATPVLIKEIEKHYLARSFAAPSWNEVGRSPTPRARPRRTSRTRETLERGAIRSRGFPHVVDYAYSAASLVLPQVLGGLRRRIGRLAARRLYERLPGDGARDPGRVPGAGERLVQAVGADLGAVLDPAAERIFLVDDQAREIPVEQELLLFLRLLASDGKQGRLAFPTTVTSLVDDLVKDTDLEILRTSASLSALTMAAAGDGVIFAGSVGGGFVFPDFVPAYDGMASLCKLLELLAPVRRPLSAIVASSPIPR